MLSLLSCMARGMPLDLMQGLSYPWVQPKGRSNSKKTTRLAGPSASRSPLTPASVATVIICSLSGAETSNCSLCGLNKMYLQQLGAMFENVLCYFSSRTSF